MSEFMKSSRISSLDYNYLQKELNTLCIIRL